MLIVYIGHSLGFYSPQCRISQILMFQMMYPRAIKRSHLAIIQQPSPFMKVFQLNALPQLPTHAKYFAGGFIFFLVLPYKEKNIGENVKLLLMSKSNIIKE